MAKHIACNDVVAGCQFTAQASTEQELLERFRPNLYITGVERGAEREWAGRRLRAGEAIIGLHSLRGRCVMTTYDPETLQQDPSVLRRIVKDLGGRLGLNAYVEKGGRVAVGDPIELL